MLLGGPFSFLAGLFCLGASGVMKVAEDAQVRERYREYEKLKILPLGAQHDLIMQAKVMNKYDFGGYNCLLINQYLKNKYPTIDYSNVDSVRAVGMAKYFVEKLGYDFQQDDNPYKFAAQYTNEYMEDNKFKQPLFDEVMNCHTPEELSKVHPKKPEYGATLWEKISGPYNVVYRYRKMGFENVEVPQNMLWRPWEGEIRDE